MQKISEEIRNMKLAYWMYTGPAHIGTLRIASSFKNVHAIMHAPLGDDYFNVMQSMLERERNFTPVTTSIVDRNVLARGSEQKVIDNIIRKDKEEKPNLIILTPTCTSSILQEDLQNFVERASLNSKADVILAEVNHYRISELQAADKTLEQIIKFYVKKGQKSKKLKIFKSIKPSINLIGVCTLGFHHNHDIRELKKIFNQLEIKINLIFPKNALIEDLQLIPKAWLNIVIYREIGLLTSQYLKNQFNRPYINCFPIGIIGFHRFLDEIQKNLKDLTSTSYLLKNIINKTKTLLKLNWIKQKLIYKKPKAIVFGTATHAASLTRILTKEIGIEVILSGTYCISDQVWFKEEIQNYCNNILITEDHTIIGNLISKLKPDIIFGTQMERHIGKRLNIPCAVISSPIHIQNFPLMYKPFIGYEGIKQLYDLIYNTLNCKNQNKSFEIFKKL